MAVMSYEMDARFRNTIKRFEAAAERDPELAELMRTFYFDATFLLRGDPAQQMAFIFELLGKDICKRLAIKDAALDLMPLVQPEPEPSQPVGPPDTTYRYEPPAPPSRPRTMQQTVSAMLGHPVSAEEIERT